MLASLLELANAGIAEELRIKLSGHASKSSHGIYTRLQLRTLAEAVAKLPALRDLAQGHVRQ